MKQIKILTYSIDFSLSNIYLKVMIQPLEPRIFDEKNEVILYKKKIELNLNFLIKYLRF